MDSFCPVQGGLVPKIEEKVTLDNIKCVRSAQKEDLKQLSVLFNSYRCFYGRDSDLSIATEFLSERLEHKDSTIFIAESENGLLAGFVQLYPTFSSVSAKRAWILNDLYISDDYRRRGVANQLMSQALEYCRENGAAWVSLQTALDNTSAQALYEKIGFSRENYFCGYSYSF